MKKLSTGLAGLLAIAAMNASAAVYTTSGELTGYSVDAAVPTTVVWDPDPLSFTGNWDIDLDTGVFSGDMYFGDYVTTATTSLGGAAVSAFGINQHVSGVGTWDAGSNTFSFVVPTAGSNEGGASIGTESAPSTCVPSGTFGGTACDGALGTSPDWEGLSISLVFSEDLMGFTGTVQSVSVSGEGIAANTTVQDYGIVGEVPLPAAAWLFGSGLLGLAGMARRRRQQA